MVDVVDAQDLARRYLAETLPRRWQHVQGVAARAEGLRAVGGDVLVAAAWLHDIGYAPGVVDTGFHPLDGARLLRRLRVDERLVSLVAFHSCAHLEAEERGLRAVLEAEFQRETSDVADALCFCDMTTSPDGELVEVETRLAEIQERYGREHLVSRFIRRATPEIIAMADRTRQRFAVG